MKKNQVLKFGALFVFGCLLTSCQEDDEGESITESNATDVVTLAERDELENAVNEINTIVGDNFGVDMGTGKSVGTEKSYDCITITADEDDNGNVEVIIDYGEECELRNGAIVSGSIIVTYAIADDEFEIVYTLQNYVYNDIEVTGSAVAVYDYENEDANLGYTYSSNFNFAWPDGLTAIDSTTYTTETVFEENEENFFDFYTLVTGSGATEFSNGDSYTFEITSPLRSEPGCRYYVSGIIINTENTATTTLDYGDGTCDAIAIETDSDGNVTTVDLNRKENNEDSES
ncbi:MAG: hypothetical protein AAGB24_09380 [Bacteroidota bacterium]